MKRLGFIGTDAITSAVVKGLAKSELKSWPIILSPRSRERASELATNVPTVKIARNNQAVVDASDIVFLAIRPQIATEIVSALQFRSDQVIVSLVAGLPIKSIRDLAGADISMVRTIPLPSVETRSCTTPVTPPNNEVSRLFDELGSSINVENEDLFDGHFARSAVMASYFGTVKASAEWMIVNGLNAEDADRYMHNLFGNLGDVMRERSSLTFDQLREDHTTKGGLNEMVHDIFLARGGADALKQGLDAVMKA